MNTSYGLETLARQRTDETARRARTASERREIKVRAGLALPQGRLPTRYRVTFTPRPA